MFLSYLKLPLAVSETPAFLGLTINIKIPIFNGVAQKVISQFYDRLSLFERYSFIKAWTSECIDFVIKLATRANESLTSMLNSNKISLSKVGIVNCRFVSTKFGVPRKEDNIQIPIFNGVAQKVILASDHCEISTTLNINQ